MKRILLPIITLLLIGLTLISCDLFGGSDEDVRRLIYLDVTVSPSNYVFSDGENIRNNLSVKGIFSDSSEKVVTNYSTSLLGDKVTSKTNSVTVTYETKTKTIPISVGESLGTLERIEVFSLPTKTTYDENEEFDESGLMVVGVYSGNHIKQITDYKLSISNGTNLGTVSGNVLINTKTNKVTYEGKTTSFDIRIEKKYYTMKEGIDWFPFSVQSITEIVFDYTDNLPPNIKDNLTTSSTSVGFTNSDLIYCIVDGTKVYVFSDELICGHSDCSYMFSYFTSLRTITLNNFNTSNVTNMGRMFYSCGQLTSLDLSNFDTSKVTYMDYMFGGCSNLISLDLSSFDIKSTTNRTSVPTIGGMFDGVTISVQIYVNDPHYWRSIFSEYPFISTKP